MIRVYTASKLSKAKFWRDIHDSCPHVYFHARWLKHDLIETPDSAENAEIFWLEDEEDIRSADCLVVYATKGEHLRGALVEVGMAIAYGKTVYVIGEHPDYGTWQYHPSIYRISTIKDWLELLCG